MSRVQRIRRRRAGDSAATHEHARGLTAQRLDGPLRPADGAWLDQHLVDCAICRSVAAAYEADRAALRGLRDHRPEPPRDLWARTSVAIEREAAARGGPPRRAASGRNVPRPALGVLSGVAVIAVVIGASVMSGGFFRGPTTAIAPVDTAPPLAIASSGPTPGPTPLTVGAGDVGWIGTSADGALAYNVTAVDAVCPAERQPDCANVSDGNAKRVEIGIRPKSISQSPVRNQAVVVGTDAAGGDAVLVVSLPTAEPTATPSTLPSARPTKTASPTATPITSDVPASPRLTPGPSPSAAPTAVATPTPSVEPTSAATPSSDPSVSPAPTAASPLAIVSGVKVVGESASYSPDGAWFAFTARPSDGSSGPDIYVWRVGDPLARPLTQDHTSVFGSWVGSRLVGSRPTTLATTATPEVTARSFFLDPATGVETPIAAPAWRPIADPNGRWAVLWDGTVRLGLDGLTSLPATGSLTLRGFTPTGGVNTAGAVTSVADGPVTEFDVRWDETGTWLAIWLADATDPAIGRLSLVHLDPASGSLERPHGAPQDVTALPGFSIANGRLAWATPPGQGGEGSRVQIVAWTDKAVGAVESGPVQDVVVVH